MKKIFIFRHESWIKAGYFINQLGKFNIPFEWIAIDQGDVIPESITEDMGGLVFLGGTMSVNDSFPWIDEELRLIRQAHAVKLPVLGFCFGSQLISKALGGEVTPMPSKEIGWHKVYFENTPLAKEWLGDVPKDTEIIIWHHEQFSIPQGASSLYTTNHCKKQAFVIDNTLAVVGHIELSAEMLKEWLEIYGHDIEENGGSVQSAESIETNLSHKMQKMHQLSNVFFLKWLSLIYPETIAKLNTISFVNIGSCLCGNIKYKLTQPRKIVNCHCGECRKFHGNYAAYTQVLKSNIEITNEEDVSWYQQTKEKTKRGWCRICGSSLFWMPINSDSICVAAGTLEAPCNLKTTKHIYVDNKSDYYTIDDGLEKYPGTMYAEHVA